MNEINFTGIKNIGALNVLSYKLGGDNLPTEGKYLVANLTNDYNGRDLDEFKNAKKACGSILDGYIFPHDSNFVHISSKRQLGKENPKLYLNMKEIPVQRETMPMFSYIAKLLRKISGMEDSKMYTASDFKYGEAGDLYILGDNRISNSTINLEEYLTAIENAFSPNNVKCTAKNINHDLQKQMEAYFA